MMTVQQMTPEQKNAALGQLVEIFNLRLGGTVTLRATRDIDIPPAEIAAMLHDAGAPEPWHWHDIPPAEIAAILRAAGVPEPWDDATASDVIAAKITFRWPKPPKRARSAQDRAQGAIGALRRALPILIADREAMVKFL